MILKHLENIFCFMQNNSFIETLFNDLKKYCGWILPRHMADPHTVGPDPKFIVWCIVLTTSFKVWHWSVRLKLNHYLFRRHVYSITLCCRSLFQLTSQGLLLSAWKPRFSLSLQDGIEARGNRRNSKHQSNHRRILSSDDNLHWRFSHFRQRAITGSGAIVYDYIWWRHDTETFPPHSHTESLPRVPFWRRFIAVR